jgi:hypothetical protein
MIHFDDFAIEGQEAVLEVLLEGKRHAASSGHVQQLRRADGTKGERCVLHVEVRDEHEVRRCSVRLKDGTLCSVTPIDTRKALGSGYTVIGVVLR